MDTVWPKRFQKIHHRQSDRPYGLAGLGIREAEGAALRIGFGPFETDDLATAAAGQGDLANDPRRREGKRAGRHSAPQPLICDLIVKAALSGQRVVRLKGGDPSIFGRATEEIAACCDAGVIVQVCAGVTTASAAAASLGASLTLRGLARRLVFVTAHTQRGAVPDLDWQALADPEATLAVYMGKDAAPHIARGLRDAGLAADTPVIVIENVSLPQERQFATDLAMLPLAARTALGDGPAMILIGQAMQAVQPVAQGKESGSMLAATLEDMLEVHGSVGGQDL